MREPLGKRRQINLKNYLLKYTEYDHCGQKKTLYSTIKLQKFFSGLIKGDFSKHRRLRDI